MKVAVIGGTGLVGSQVVRMMRARGHEAVPHSPSTGVDVLSGDGLARALGGVDVVVNLTNSPTFDEEATPFFRTSMDNLLAAAAAAGVGHAVILSIVGVDRVPDSAYYRAKVLQEDLLKAGPGPYSIVRSTQFDEFLDAVISATSGGDTVRLPSTRVQPIASADIARIVTDAALGAPLNGIRSAAGPEVFGVDELGRITLEAHGDQRIVVRDDSAGMFATPKGDALIPADGDRALIATTTYREWLSSRLAQSGLPGQQNAR